ncbi:hypothetical protein AG1IA_08150 [Rhizoctonia solani AG-1 IA]|uniref:Uncharacterized protein n=1 Tax=Thanatephorus cucumeris (strain AG1-IA) TaxID=983506 RepID=L8WM59_THACA|nr:hypothetical protein AG1IA_08150 [Rhizoctonia solani AG-1 IA]
MRFSRRIVPLHTKTDMPGRSGKHDGPSPRIQKIAYHTSLGIRNWGRPRRCTQGGYRNIKSVSKGERGHRNIKDRCQDKIRGAKRSESEIGGEGREGRKVGGLEIECVAVPESHGRGSYGWRIEGDCTIWCCSDQKERDLVVAPGQKEGGGRGQWLLLDDRKA